MNGVRTIFLRKGYLLTALAAAVLLAASPGTAQAQTVGWSTSTATAYEGATAAANTPKLLTVNITRTGTVPQGSDAATYWGTITVLGLGGTDGVALTNVPGAGTISDDGSITWINNGASVMIAGDADDDWLDNELVLSLQTTQPKVDITTPKLTISVVDAHLQPVARFSKSKISLTEDSSTDVMARIGVESATTTDVPAALAAISTGTVRVMVTPADALYHATSNKTGPLEISVGGTDLVASAAPNNKPGVYDLDDIADLVTGTTNGKMLTGGVAVTVKARTDMGGFTDPMVEVAFDGASLKTDDGQIMAGASLMIEVQSDEPVPTVSFSPANVTIPEGGDATTVLLSEGAHGSEVEMVKLSVKGDAMVDLYQGGTMLEEEDGHVTVSLKDTNSARLTVMSTSDRDLEDGMTKSKTWTIVEADNANIGGDSALMVTVEGSTAVPALPLVGQLLLALFLMAGGSRLYRRRG